MELLEALTPSVEDFAAYKSETVESLGASSEEVSMHLRIAAALLILATGMRAVPDPLSPIGVIVRSAVLDMAWFIGTSMDDRDAMFSPFSSERIGSYSYSKASKAALSGSDTGVPFFDLALKYFGRDDEDGAAGMFLVSSESVFSQPLVPKRPSVVTVISSPDRQVIPDPDFDPFEYIRIFEGEEG